jgi:hypothetical protein
MSSLRSLMSLPLPAEEGPHHLLPPPARADSLHLVLSLTGACSPAHFLLKQTNRILLWEPGESRPLVTVQPATHSPAGLLCFQAHFPPWGCVFL